MHTLGKQKPGIDDDGNTNWNSGSEEEDDESDKEGSLDEFFMDERDFDMLPSLYLASVPTSYGLQLIASVFHEKNGYQGE